VNRIKKLNFSVNSVFSVAKKSVNSIKLHREVVFGVVEANVFDRFA